MKYVLRNLQMSSVDKLLPGIKKRVSKLTGKYRYCVIGILKYLYVQGRILNSHFSEN